MGSCVQVMTLSPSCLTEGVWCSTLLAAHPLTASTNRRVGRRFIAAVVLDWTRGLCTKGGHSKQLAGRFEEECI